MAGGLAPSRLIPTLVLEAQEVAGLDTEGHAEQHQMTAWSTQEAGAVGGQTTRQEATGVRAWS